ncbi:MAG TPA: hypothetical protein VF463_16940 [Sphingobium sp.]
MKADISLAERQRLEAQDQQALRAALVRRHTEVLDEQHAIEGVQVAMDINSPAYWAMAARFKG